MKKVKTVLWKSLRKYLIENLGGQIGKPQKDLHRIVSFPNGKVVRVSSDDFLRKEIGRYELNNVSRQLREAGFDPVEIYQALSDTKYHKTPKKEKEMEAIVITANDAPSKKEYPYSLKDVYQLVFPSLDLSSEEGKKRSHSIYKKIHASKILQKLQEEGEVVDNGYANKATSKARYSMSESAVLKIAGQFKETNERSTIKPVSTTVPPAVYDEIEAPIDETDELYYPKEDGLDLIDAKEIVHETLALAYAFKVMPVLDGVKIDVVNTLKRAVSAVCSGKTSE